MVSIILNHHASMHLLLKERQNQERALNPSSLLQGKTQRNWAAAKPPAFTMSADITNLLRVNYQRFGLEQR
jgi:hypothetical protein